MLVFAWSALVPALPADSATQVNEATREPTSSGLAIPIPPPECSKTPANSGPLVESCIWAYSLLEADPMRDYLVLWYQMVVTPRARECLHEVRLRFLLKSGAELVAAGPVLDGKRLPSSRHVFQASFSAGDMPLSNFDLAQVYLTRGGTLESRLSSEAYELTWKGRTTKSVGLAFGVEVATEFSRLHYQTGTISDVLAVPAIVCKTSG